MTWASTRPGHHTRGDWTNVRDETNDRSGRPWLLRDAKSVDPVGGTRHHTLALAKQSADNWDAVRAGRSRP